MSWPLAALGDIAPAKPIKLNGYTPSDRIWQVTLDQIESNTGLLLEKSIKPLSEAGSSTHAFDDRHVLYSKLRPYLNKVMLPDEIGLGTTELVPMLPVSGKLDRVYLAHYLKSKTFVNWISSQTAGAKMPRVSMNTFWEHEIPLPPLAEQKRIAAILDKADSLRRKNQQAIQLADQFLRAVFLDMFGDPLSWTRQSIPLDWKEQPIGKIAHLKRGYDLPVQSRNVGKVPIYAANGVVGYHDEAKTQGPGVITGRSGTLGTVMYSKRSYWPLNTSLYVTDFFGNEPRYIQWFLQFYKLDRYNRGAGVPTLNRNLFLEEISFVPPKELQVKFVKIFDKVSAILSKVNASSGVELFDSLSQKAFAGEL